MAFLVIVVAGLKAAEDVLVPLILATFLAVLSAPLVVKLHSKRVPESLAVLLVVLLVLAVLSGLAALLGGSINRFVVQLPRYQQKLQASFSAAVEWAGQYGLSTDSLKKVANPGAVLDVMGRTMSSIAASLSDALLIVLTVAFMLFEVSGVPRKLRRALGNPELDLRGLARMMDDVKSYVIIKTYVSIATGVCIAGLALGLGLDFPLLWGLLAFLLNYIPTIGSILAAVPAVLLGAVQLGWVSAVTLLGGYLLVNFVFGNVVEPRAMGRKLGLSALVVWLSLVFWGWLWGPIGMLLSVPLTMVVKILLEHSPQFRAVAVMMDSPGPEPSAAVFKDS